MTRCYDCVYYHPAMDLIGASCCQLGNDTPDGGDTDTDDCSDFDIDPASAIFGASDEGEDEE